MALIAEDLTEAAIAAFYRVYNTLGFGFLESVYVAAMVHELMKAAFAVQREAPIEVHYDGSVLGHYRADILVEGRLILEIKTEVGLTGAAERQLRNYLRASQVEVGILFVFGPQPRFKRLIHTHDRKQFTQE